jgi:non-ribosomal peptide synthetase component F
MVVTLLAILKAGGAYLPLDPGYPVERLHFKLEDAQVRVVVSQSDLVERLRLPGETVLCLDRDFSELAGSSRDNPGAEVDPSNLAYCIYTSGSSGKPQGVMIEHAAASHFVLSAIEHYGISASDCMLQFGSISFDLAVEEIFTCLASGGRLQLRDEDMLGTPARFVQRCRDWGVTILDLPTAYWHQLVAEMEHGDLRMPEEVRLVIIGEWWAIGLVFSIPMGRPRPPWWPRGIGWASGSLCGIKCRSVDPWPTRRFMCWMRNGGWCRLAPRGSSILAAEVSPEAT